MIRSRIVKAGVSMVAVMLLLTGGQTIQAGVTQDAGSKYLDNVQKGESRF